MAVTIGSKQLLEANLVIVSGITFKASFIYKDENGNPIDLSGWKAYLDFFKMDAKILDCDGCIGLSSDGLVDLSIPQEITAQLEKGKYDYDIILEDPEGGNVRLVAGKATVYVKYSEEG